MFVLSTYNKKTHARFIHAEHADTEHHTPHRETDTLPSHTASHMIHSALSVQQFLLNAKFFYTVEWREEEEEKKYQVLKAKVEYIAE